MCDVPAGILRVLIYSKSILLWGAFRSIFMLINLLALSVHGYFLEWVYLSKAVRRVCLFFNTSDVTFCHADEGHEHYIVYVVVDPRVDKTNSHACQSHLHCCGCQHELLCLLFVAVRLVKHGVIALLLIRSLQMSTGYFQIMISGFP